MPNSLSLIAPRPTIRGARSHNAGSVLGVAWRSSEIRAQLQSELTSLMASVPKTLRSKFIAKLNRLMKENAPDARVVQELRTLTDPARERIRWGGEILGNYAADRVSEKAALLFPFPPTNILNVSAGLGDVTSRVAEKLRTENPRVPLQAHVIDITHEYVRHRGKGFQRTGMGRDGKLPFTSNSRDAASLFMALHHTLNPSHLISEIRRVLHADGALVIHEDNAHTVGHVTYGEALDLLSFRVLWPTEEMPRGTHRPLDEWTALITQHGFRHIKTIKDKDGGHEFSSPHFALFRKAR